MALALAVVVLAGLSPAMPAFAATSGNSAFSDVSGTSPYAAALDALGALGVYTGDSGLGGRARPNDTIPREEVAAVMGRLAGHQTEVAMAAKSKLDFRRRRSPAVPPRALVLPGRTATRARCKDSVKVAPLHSSGRG